MSSSAMHNFMLTTLLLCLCSCHYCVSRSFIQLKAVDNQYASIHLGKDCALFFLAGRRNRQIALSSPRPNCSAPDEDLIISTPVSPAAAPPPYTEPIAPPPYSDVTQRISMTVRHEAEEAIDSED